MKVRELMAELAKADPEAEVITEGCDCTGEVDQVLDGTQFVHRDAHRAYYGAFNAVDGPKVVLVRPLGG